MSLLETLSGAAALQPINDSRAVAAIAVRAGR
jgi:hypothetical protein